MKTVDFAGPPPSLPRFRSSASTKHLSCAYGSATRATFSIGSPSCKRSQPKSGSCSIRTGPFRFLGAEASAVWIRREHRAQRRVAKYDTPFSLLPPVQKPFRFSTPTKHLSFAYGSATPATFSIGSPSCKRSQPKSGSCSIRTGPFRFLGAEASAVWIRREHRAQRLSLIHISEPTRPY